MIAHSISIILLASLLSISGCGGGEEETAVEEVVTTPSPVNNSIPETIATGDLISAPDFNLISFTKLQISLPASPSTTISYFVNVCTDFTNDLANDDIIINYASCKLRTKLAITAQQFTLSLSAAEEQLIAQIWPIENGALPINIYWNIADSGKNWQIIF